ncbi:hypothetical protein LTR37_015765 [Vermiconidia calcicola]|uniref:Uncharacterized protein n=1 Tax=Vermiconidia calcicola TaxID=1690605 RepID=A0ACC3MRE2_9PEZI|nr:hypothetical protein LTR37_015765 [Vermiconidia calcicola]
MLRHASTLHKAPLLRTTRPPYSHRIKHASSSSKPQQQAQKEPSTILSYIRHGITYGLGVLLITHITFTHILEYNPCYGISMLPTFNSFGDWVLISKYYRRGRGIAVGDIVSYAHPHEPYERAIKRVMGLPGDVVMRDTPGVGTGKGMMVQVPEGHGFEDVWPSADGADQGEGCGEVLSLVVAEEA